MAILDCALLTTDIGACTDTTSKGFAQKAVIINYSEIATKTISVTDPLITALSLGANTGQTVIVKGMRPFEELTVTATERRTGMVFGNQLQIPIKGLTPATSKTVKTLADGRFAVILTQLGETGNAKYPAMGFQGGLKASAVEWSAEEGAWIVTLDEASNDQPVLFVWATDLATTDALVEGLLT